MLLWHANLFRFQSKNNYMRKAKYDITSKESFSSFPQHPLEDHLKCLNIETCITSQQRRHYLDGWVKCVEYASMKGLLHCTQTHTNPNTQCKHWNIISAFLKRHVPSPTFWPQAIPCTSHAYQTKCKNIALLKKCDFSLAVSNPFYMGASFQWRRVSIF